MAYGILNERGRDGILWKGFFKGAALLLFLAAVVWRFAPNAPRAAWDLAEGLASGVHAAAEQAEPVAETEVPITDAVPLTVPVQARYISYRVEEAAPQGERAPELTPEPEEPAAVAAFLERQAAFADYALPENVDCDYATLPFDCMAPVGGESSSGFGYRVHPIENVVKFHYGTDFAADAGTEVCAFADGVVTAAGWSDSFGYYITIEHGDAWQTLYAHCGTLYVQSGQAVSAGECIALVGSSGAATGPHLHFELTCGGVYHNPEYYVSG